MSQAELPTVTDPASQNTETFFEKRGFVIVEDAIPLEKINAIKSEIQAILNAEARRNLDVEPTSSDRFDKYLEPLFNLDSDYRGRLYDLLQDMHSLYRAGLSEDILTVVDEVGIKAPNIRNAGTRVDIPEEDDILQPLHQDLNNSKSSTVCWMPLQKVTPENGALRVFVGSNELGPLNRTEEEHGYKGISPDRVEQYQEAHCTIDAGDVAFLHPNTVHASETNRSDQIRWTATIRFNDATDMGWLREGVDPFDKYR